MQTGILLAFLAYLAYACSDAAAKALGAHMSVFQIGFSISLVALLLCLLSKKRSDSWRAIASPKRPGLVALRAVSGTFGGICAVIAFTTLPLAEAYALIFLLPLVAALLSRTVLRESVTPARWFALVGGLFGVLLVVRPGFQELSLGHLAGLGCALSGACNVILLRTLGPSENRLTLIGSVLSLATVLNGVLMVPSFVVPPVDLWPILLFGGVAAGIGHLSMVMGARLAPASRIAPTQYSQIVWASLFGAVLFGEFPDPLAVTGMALVGFFGMLTLAPERRVGAKNPLLRRLRPKLRATKPALGKPEA